jgi:hypothetical protein
MNPSEITWSPSLWATWKKCPLKFKIRADMWTGSPARSQRIPALAVPGLVIDRLFETWLRRGNYNDFSWLQGNYDDVFQQVELEGKPTWIAPEESPYIRRTTRSSVRILFDLLHTHQLLNPCMGIQTKFRESIADGINIVGAIDLWTIRKDGALVVVDFKNYGAKTHRSVDQLHFYALALQKLKGREPEEAGYLCFNPSSPGYRKSKLRLCDQKRLLARIGRANAALKGDEFKAKYNFMSCSRFCEVRFACPEFGRRREEYLVAKKAATSVPSRTLF